MNSGTYLNGNVVVKITGDGVKERRTLRIGQIPEVVFPESLDIQITEKCKNGCPFCYNNSRPQGRTCDPQQLISALSPLPQGIPIELAFGGGSLLEAKEEVKVLTTWARGRGYLTRGTFHSSEVTGENIGFISENFDAMGISIQSLENCKGVEEAIDVLPFYYPGVYHIILGLFPLKDLEELLNRRANILCLGLKMMGRASGAKLKDIEEYKKLFKRALFRRSYDVWLSFDNLALEQLSLKDDFPSDLWNTHYQGGEFTNTMFVDAVNQKFAPSSIEIDKGISWNENNILDYFNENKNNWI